MSAYDDRPWLGLYGDQPADKEPEFTHALEMFRAGVAADPSGVAVKYFDGVLMRQELDEQSERKPERRRPACRAGRSRAATSGS